MKTYNTFYFEKFRFDIQTGEAIFFYSFDEEIFFEEKVHFFDADFILRKNLDMEIIENILFHIHIALGISYYKTFLPENLILKTGKLDDFQISFWKKFYLNGLGEFFYKNNIDPNWLLHFSSESQTEFGKKDFTSSEKYLVPIGWGKDSIVSIELLKNMWEQIDTVTFAQNDNVLYENTAKNSGLKRLFIQRELSKNISLLNTQWAYNGHVPITGMIAFILELVSYLYDYKYIILSNEKSANFWNTLYQGIEINHQWSKSLDFEKDFEAYVVKYISGSVKYFSLLRPFYELKIAQYFAKFGKKYFSSFSSCNVNFKIFKKIPPPTGTPFEKGRKENHPSFSKGVAESQGINSFWCNSCPKCAFVYTILRPFLSEEEILSIFGRELYEDKNLETLFRELAGISGIKPFECVGTNEEVILAMQMAWEKFPKKLPFILEIFQKEVQSKMTQTDFELLRKKIFIPEWNENIIPPLLLQKLKSYE